MLFGPRLPDAPLGLLPFIASLHSLSLLLLLLLLFCYLFFVFISSHESFGRRHNLRRLRLLRLFVTRACGGSHCVV